MDGVFLSKLLAIGIRGSRILTGDCAVTTPDPAFISGLDVVGGKVVLDDSGIFALEASSVSSVAAGCVCRCSVPASMILNLTGKDMCFRGGDLL